MVRRPQCRLDEVDDLNGLGHMHGRFTSPPEGNHLSHKFPVDRHHIRHDVSHTVRGSVKRAARVASDAKSAQGGNAAAGRTSAILLAFSFAVLLATYALQRRFVQAWPVR